MSYTKQTWAGGDTVTSAKLNHMEDGIAGAGPDLVFEVDSTDPSQVTSATLISGSYADAAAKVNDGGYLTAHVYTTFDDPYEKDTITFGVVYCAHFNFISDEDVYAYVKFTDGNVEQGISLHDDGTITIGV